MAGPRWQIKSVVPTHKASTFNEVILKTDAIVFLPTDENRTDLLEPVLNQSHLITLCFIETYKTALFQTSPCLDRHYDDSTAE